MMPEPERVGPYIDFVVPAALEGERLDRAVAMLAGCSRSLAAAIVSSAGVLVNGAICTKTSNRLSEGDRLVVHKGPETPSSDIVADPEIDFEVLLEDDHIAVIDKPAGLVVHPGAGNPDGTLVNGLVHRYPTIETVGDPSRPGIVHRLDSGTSGLMVVAKDQRAYEGLVHQLAARLVERTYTALVVGHLEHPRGLIDAPVGRSRRDPLKMAVSVEGKDARTRYEVDRVYTEPMDTSLLTCNLETGRTHQIRVHLSSIGHPVVGDERYGGARKRFQLGRPFLHARELRLSHPVTGEEIHCVSELPEDLSRFLGTLS